MIKNILANTLIGAAITFSVYLLAQIWALKIVAAIKRRVKAKSFHIPPDPSPFQGMTAEEITKARGLVSATDYGNLSY